MIRTRPPRVTFAPCASPSASSRKDAHPQDRLPVEVEIALRAQVEKRKTA
jgi:hypothetical protein